MKSKLIVGFFSGLCALVLFFIVVGCGSGGSNSSSSGGTSGTTNTVTPDPPGTITTELRKQGQGNYAIDLDTGTTTNMPSLYYDVDAINDLSIDINGNFSCSHFRSTISDVGSVTGVGDIISVPSSGFVSGCAAIASHGYVIKTNLPTGLSWITDEIKTYRIFVSSYITSSATGGVIGFRIKWNTL
jgi:hypothetical protein